MPVELLPYSPAYTIVGIYRLLTDPKLYGPIWQRSSRAIKKAAIIAAIWFPFAWPLTRFFVKHFAKRVQVARYSDKATSFGMSVEKYTTAVFVLGQCSMILEFWLAKEIKYARAHAYEETVKSRGKDKSFWIPYVEEWAEPPKERAMRALEKSSFLETLGTPLVRILVLKLFLLPLAFIPFLTNTVTAYMKSLTMAKKLHQPYFKAKNMSPFEQELFIVERQFEFRAFGFAAALLERLPIVGLVLSISNRVGASMWAFDLEKRQHAYQSGELKPTKRYVSKEAQIPKSDLPSDFAGSFPDKKMPVRIQ